jgi:hypothetical protein
LISKKRIEKEKERKKEEKWEIKRERERENKKLRIFPRKLCAKGCIFLPLFPNVP